MSDIVTLKNKKTGEIVKLRRKETEQPAQDTETNKSTTGEVALKAVADIVPGTRFAVRFYEGLLKGEGMGSSLDKATRETAKEEEVQPTGLGQKVLSGLITGAGRIPFYMGGAGAATGAMGAYGAAHPIISGMAGMAGVGAGQELVSGHPENMASTGAINAATYPVMHAAGALGNIAPKEVLRKLVTGLGFSTIGAVQAKLQGGDAEDIMSEAMIGFGLGASSKKSADPKNLRTEASTKAAESLVNYVLKPSKGTKEYGASPARAVVKEGLWGKNLEDLGVKADVKAQELNSYKDVLKNDATNARARINLWTGNNVFEPILKLKAEFNKAAPAHKAELDAIQNQLTGILNPSGKGRKLNNLTINEAYEIKNIVDGLKPGGIMDASGHPDIVGALRKVRYNITEAINNAPGVSKELKITNKRLQDVISLKEAISDASKRNPAPWKTLPLPLLLGYGIKGPAGLAAAITTFAAETVPGSTLIGKLIGKKY